MVKKLSASAVSDPAAIEAKREARAKKKEREASEREEKERQAEASGLSVPVVDAQGRPLYRPRQWGLVRDAPSEPVAGRRRVKVLSWNMLAQGLVRRKLFPGSDALRWKDREAGLQAELVGHDWDVGCFQEVDRIQYHAETLKKAGYSYKYSKGYLQKEHGLMLAWRCKPKQNGRSSDAIFEQEPVASEILFYDDAEVSAGRTACSRLTRNIALFLAIKFQPTDGERDHTGPAGVILATTHLFWHPMHAYERVRQASLLARYLQSFRNKEGATWSSWPTVLAGDFNDQPHSASYALLTGRGLDNHGRAEIEQSSVVHQSVDKRTEAARRRPTGALQDPAGLNNAAEPLDPKETSREDDVDHIDGDPTGDEEEQEAADDQMLKSCRAATTSDGLLTPEDLIALFNTSHKPTSIGCESVQPAPGHMLSAYGSKYALLQDPQESDNMFSTSTRGRERWDDQDWKDGDLNVHRHLAGTTAGSEPMCTLYSSLFALTLDFIFLLPFKNNEGSPVYPAVTRLLRTHRTEVVKEGLPRKGICVSDHMAIGAELEF